MGDTVGAGASAAAMLGLTPKTLTPALATALQAVAGSVPDIVPAGSIRPRGGGPAPAP